MNNTIKKLIATALLAVMVLSLAACGGKSAASDKYAYLLEDFKDLELVKVNTKSEGVLAEVLKNGKLVVATSPDYPPAEWITEDGTVYGSEMMLAKYIADCLGVELAIETMDFNSTMLAVDTGKTSIAISGYGWKADREESYELSNGYIGDPENESYHTLICPAGEESKYKSLEDFVGTHIIAQASSLQQMYVEDQILSLDTDGTTELELVAQLDQAILSLASGKCDALALDSTTAKKYVEESGGKFALTGIKFDLEMYGVHEGNVILAKKGETAMMDAINEIIDFVMEKGYYEDFYMYARKKAGVDE
jgi:polar amino acid transport system substrate-binding protein